LENNPYWFLLIPPGSRNLSWLNGISCTSPKSCTAVGSFATGSRCAITLGLCSDIPLAVHWNGTRWSIQHAPAGGTLSSTQCPTGHGCSAGGVFNAVSCLSRTACIAVGSFINLDGTQRVLSEKWNGTAWTALGT
jgi:hypothetical protein